MSSITKGGLFRFLLTALSSATLHAATYTAATCNTSDVQTAINSAANGDTVIIPAGTCAWSSGVTISTAITITGAGSGRIVAYSLNTLALGTGTVQLTISPDNVAGTPPSLTVGQTIKVSELGFRANFMQGTVNSYNSSTGALSLNATSSGGTCGTVVGGGTMDSNCARWLISTNPSTIIVNNIEDTAAFNITESSAGHINISGIKFAYGANAGPHMYIYRASGGKAVLVHDNWFELKSVSDNNNVSHAISTNSSRGVVWNCSFDSSPFTLVFSAFMIKDANNTAMPTSWTTPSTMGTSDVANTAFCSMCGAGENNFYVENCDFHAIGNLTNVDDNGRLILRYSFLNNSSIGTHGADTSNVGQRYFEFYNNVAIFQGYNSPYSTCGCTYTANLSAWLWLRGGTFVAHDNILPQMTSTDYGTHADFLYAVENLSRDAGNHACWGIGTTNGADYHAPRQVGFGWVTGTGTATGSQINCSGTGRLSSTSFSGSTDAITYVGDSEPAYIWNTQRASGGAYTAMTVGAATAVGDSACSPWDSQSNYVQANRDYFNTATTAKPGYTPYTYPHPLTQGTGVAPPTGLISVVH